MAIGTPSASPAVVVKEIDLSGTVPGVTSTTGAFVGNFRWGPVEQVMDIGNESVLAATFATPDAITTVDFHSASYFLKYSGDLKVVRAATSDAKNSSDSDQTGLAPTIKNLADFDAQADALDSDGHTFIAKYPSELGDALTVSMCPASSSDFATWTYKSSFDVAPGTSAHASDLGATNDEVHVAVIDRTGAFGAVGAVLEVFPHVSLALGAKTTDGSVNYIKDVINNRSNFVWLAGYDAEFTTANAGSAAIDSRSFLLVSPEIKTYAMVNGADSGNLTIGDYATGFDLFEDADTITVDFLIAPQATSRAIATAVTNDLVATAQGLRKDCIVVASPARSDVIGVTSSATVVTNVITTADTFTTSSYLVVDNNFLKVYDKYNDKFIFIPAASSTAGIMAASDANAAPWVSPAGARRGQYLGITSISYSADKTQRDSLYKAGINPISNIPGQGVLLFGDKTKLNRPSAFDRINVRRLFLVVERAIGEAAKNVMFEINDEFTRAEFVNIVEPFLREIKGRRGITDFRVVCDETNNTSAVVDNNEFIASVFIKPARSINYVTLNFVAVRTGVDFEEVVGTV
jgi:hypothetical protein